MSNRTTALNRTQFETIVNNFEHAGDYRMSSLCMLMAKCVRVGDVLGSIKIQDVYTAEGKVREFCRFNEQKTGKTRTVSLKGARLRNALNIHFKALQGTKKDANLFFNRQGLPLQDKGVKWMLAQFVGTCSIEQCSPHSFRKYGAKYMHQNGIDIESISEILNHRNVSDTRTYLDIKKKEIAKAEALLDY